MFTSMCGLLPISQGSVGMFISKSPTFSKVLRNSARIPWVCTVFNVNYYSSSSSSRLNHYDVLGVTPKSSHTEIKSAYYKMSKEHHPDLNAGSQDAALKFRQVTAAYEVLGNQRLRRLYDKGLLTLRTTSMATYSPDPTTEDFKESSFHKSRHQRSKAPTTGRTHAYDFDTWSKHHYGIAFDRRMKAKARWAYENEAYNKGGGQREIFVFFLFSFTFLIVTLATRHALGDYDTPKKTSS